MNAAQLANQAISQARRFEGILAQGQVEKIAKAWLADWLYSQDDSIAAEKVRATFCASMNIITDHFNG